MSGPDSPAQEQLFRVEIQQHESHSLLVLAGQIGADAAPQLRNQALLLTAGAGPVDIDWREAETVTAGSLQVLLALGIALSQRGQPLRVVADHPNLRRLLDVAGLSAHFPVGEPLP